MFDFGRESYVRGNINAIYVIRREFCSLPMSEIINDFGYPATKWNANLRKIGLDRLFLAIREVSYH